MNQTSKMLVLDLDGTLTNSDKIITKKTKQALLKMQQAGHTVVLASGRPTPGVMPLAEELELKKYGGYVLSFNGGRIWDCKKECVLSQQTLPSDIIPELFEQAENLGMAMISYEKDHIIVGDIYNKYIDEEKRINKLPVCHVPNIGTYIDFPVNKCLATAEPALAQKAEIIFRNRFGDRINVFRSEPFFVEMMPKGIDKAASLAHLCEITGHHRSDMIACGDGFNDVSMIQYAGLGVAMQNAQDAVKEVADYVTTSNDDDGIAKVIYEFILPEKSA